MKTFVEFIKEREAIRLKKEAGEPQPWTNDEILANNHFCNIDRNDDTFTKWLTNNWLNISHWSDVNKLVAGRFFNTPAPLIRLLKVDDTDYTGIWRAVTDSIAAGERVFNYQAYSRYLTADIADKFAELMRETTELIPVLPDALSVLYKQLQKLYGIGPFLASQMTLDAPLIAGRNFADKTTWVPVGPGSKRGIMRIIDEPIGKAAKMSDKQFIAYVQALSSEMGLPVSIIEHALCEYDKYCRLFLREKRYGRKYVSGSSLKLYPDSRSKK